MYVIVLWVHLPSNKIQKRSVSKLLSLTQLLIVHIVNVLIMHERNVDQIFYPSNENGRGSQKRLFNNQYFNDLIAFIIPVEMQTVHKFFALF